MQQRREEPHLLHFESVIVLRNQKQQELDKLEKRAQILKDEDLLTLIRHIRSQFLRYIAEWPRKLYFFAGDLRFAPEDFKSNAGSPQLVREITRNNEIEWEVDNEVFLQQQLSKVIALVSSLCDMGENIGPHLQQMSPKLSQAKKALPGLRLSNNDEKDVKDIIDNYEKETKNIYSSFKKIVREEFNESDNDNGIFQFSKRKNYGDLFTAANATVNYFKSPSLQTARTVLNSSRSVAVRSKEVGPWSRFAGHFLRFSGSVVTAGAVSSVTIATMAGLTLGTAVLGALTFGGAIAVLGVALLAYGIGSYLLKRKPNTPSKEFQKKITQLNSGIDKIESVLNQHERQLDPRIIELQGRDMKHDTKNDVKDTLKTPLLRRDRS